jgi:carbonic anhydrase/acetyltransferase-like protein (isoleucine patch superfamily)
MIRSFKGITPTLAPTAYVDQAAQVIGDVHLAEHVSIWPMAVLRGDDHFIRIGAWSNIQDGCILHEEEGRAPVLVGERVTVGHGVILHACRIASHCLIGMGAIILSNVEIGEGSIIAAGAVVPESVIIPPCSLVMGIPAKVRRPVAPEERTRIDEGSVHYARLKNIYLAERDAQ